MESNFRYQFHPTTIHVLTIRAQGRWHICLFTINYNQYSDRAPATVGLAIAKKRMVCEQPYYFYFDTLAYNLFGILFCQLRIAHGVSDSKIYPGDLWLWYPTKWLIRMVRYSKVDSRRKWTAQFYVVWVLFSVYTHNLVEWNSKSNSFSIQSWFRVLADENLNSNVNIAK